jgi:hypothetical protein
MFAIFDKFLVINSEVRHINPLMCTGKKLSNDCCGGDSEGFRYPGYPSVFLGEGGMDGR